MLRKQNTTRLGLESLEGRELPSSGLTPMIVVPTAQPVVIASQKVTPTLTLTSTLSNQPSLVQPQTVTEITKTPAGSTQVVQPTATADAVWVGFDGRFAGLRINHNQTLVRVGARKRGRRQS